MCRKCKVLILWLVLVLILSGCGHEEVWNPDNDITIVAREDGSGTRGAFTELFALEQEEGGKLLDMTTLEAQITNSTAVTIGTVAEDEYAIGYISYGSLNQSVKALAIDGAKISEETIKSGDYQIARPFNIVTKTYKESSEVADFIHFIKSRQGQKVVSEAGFVSLEADADYKSSGLSGKLVVGGSSSVSPVMEKLIEAYQQANPQMEVEMQSTDSTTGATATLEGGYDIGMISRDLKPSEGSRGLQATVIAVDGIAIIVNKLNDLDALTSAEVQKIYLGEAMTWEAVTQR
ncbi:phosphate transport system substrate-binding protein [Lachnospiraceae bacterium PF1-21]|uniref:substrate-binding domain-containing protein n=1 Tax=Ohessyouella blattaphilus TaxID=2949333 RepID=UPI003E304247